MSSTAPNQGRLNGTLRAEGGRGVVRLEERYDAELHEVWRALTDPARLADWHAKVSGDLRPGGQFRLYLAADDWEGTGRVEACEAPRRFLVTTRESDESFEKGQGMAPFDETIEVSLTPDGDCTLLVAEIRGLPLEAIAAYGAGWQLHAESLAAYLAGGQPTDPEARWSELEPAYQALAAQLAS